MREKIPAKGVDADVGRRLRGKVTGQRKGVGWSEICLQAHSCHHTLSPQKPPPSTCCGTKTSQDPEAHDCGGGLGPRTHLPLGGKNHPERGNFRKQPQASFNPVLSVQEAGRGMAPVLSTGHWHPSLGPERQSCKEKPGTGLWNW